MFRKIINFFCGPPIDDTKKETSEKKSENPDGLKFKVKKDDFLGTSYILLYSVGIREWQVVECLELDRGNLEKVPVEFNTIEEATEYAKKYKECPQNFLDKMKSLDDELALRFREIKNKKAVFENKENGISTSVEYHYTYNGSYGLDLNASYCIKYKLGDGNWKKLTKAFAGSTDKPTLNFPYFSNDFGELETFAKYLSESPEHLDKYNEEQQKIHAENLKEWEGEEIII